MTRAATTRAILRLAPLVATAALLWGCANPGGISPSGRQLSIAQLAGGQPVRRPVAWPSEQWWKDFGDERLAALVERALAGSPTLQVAAARLARARAAADFADANRKPQVGAVGDVTRQKYTANGLYPPPLAGGIVNGADLFASGSWELDFFGRNRAQLDAALGQERAAAADVQAARVLLASQVVRAWYELAWLREDRDLARTIGERREQVRSLVAERTRAGLDSGVQLQPTKGAAADARLQTEAIDERIALVRNVLAALTAQPPEALAGLDPSLRTRRLPPAVPAAVPLDLVGRRADIVAARWRVEASLHERDAAKAQFYPNVSISALAGLSSLGLANFAHSGSETWSVGPALRLPIFDAGRLRANLRGRTADVDAAIAAYNATLLDAVHEADDRIATARAIERQRDEQRAAQRAAERSLALARQKLRAGLASEISVVAAEIPVLAQRRAAEQLAARAIDNEVALIRALGGGYDSTDPPPQP